MAGIDCLFGKGKCRPDCAGYPLAKQVADRKSQIPPARPTSSADAKARHETAQRAADDMSRIAASMVGSNCANNKRR